MNYNVAIQALQSHKLPILTSQLHSGLKTYTKIWCHTPTLSLRNKQDIKHFLFILTLSYHWETLFKLHYWWCWVKFTYTGHVILQLILYKLWSTMLQYWAFQSHKLPILTSQLHLAWRATPRFGCHTPTLSLEISKILNIFSLY